MVQGFKVICNRGVKLNPESARLMALNDHGAELVRLASQLGAPDICLCGSVARGEDHEGSDLDFYVFDFRFTDPLDTRDRAERLVSEFRRILGPIGVDIRGIPGWDLGEEHEKSMKHDSIRLQAVLSRIPGDDNKTHKVSGPSAGLARDG